METNEGEREDTPMIEALARGDTTMQKLFALRASQLKASVGFFTCKAFLIYEVGDMGDLALLLLFLPVCWSSLATWVSMKFFNFLR